MIFENEKFVLGFTLIVLLISSTNVLAEEEEEEEREDLILSRFSSDVLKLLTDDESEQWENSFETEIDSLWGHEIEIKSLNNSHDLFFLISWEDDTKSVEKVPDGLALILETKEIEKPMTFEEVEENEEHEEEYEIHEDVTDIQVTVSEESWVWQADGTTSNEIFVNAEWENDKWNVAVEKKLIVDEIGEITMGEKTESFLKIAVWDGEKNQSFDNLEEEGIPELQLLVLPEINSYPKDVYVWSLILAIGTASFLIVEVKKHKVKEN